MTPTRTEIVIALLDDVLGESIRSDSKLINLRQIERVVKRMADRIEQRERDQLRRAKP